MLEMIFANGDFPEYYYNESDNKEIKIQKNNYRVVVEEDIDMGYGHYVDLDITTPPKLNYSKNSSVLNLPPKNYAVNKPMKYLPPIAEEEIFYKKNVKMDVSSTTRTIFTGITFCATVAFYYFCKTHGK